MAAVDVYVDSELVDANRVLTGKITSSGVQGGERLITFDVKFTPDATDDDDSIYRILKNVNPHLIPVTIWASWGAFAASDWDLGIYATGEGGAVYDADALSNSNDFDTATDKLTQIDAVALANQGEPLYVLAGHTFSTYKDGYDIAWITNTIGATPDKEIRTVLQFIQG